MSFQPTAPTRIVKNTIPESYVGVYLQDRFGAGFAFGFDEVLKDNLYFQSQNFLHILKSDSGEKLFELRTFTNFGCDKKIEDEGFYEYIYERILFAINDFNGHLKLNKSTLTVYKTYAPIPTLEQAKTPIRQAYLLLNFNAGTSNN